MNERSIEGTTLDTFVGSLDKNLLGASDGLFEGMPLDVPVDEILGVFDGKLLDATKRPNGGFVLGKPEGSFECSSFVAEGRKLGTIKEAKALGTLEGSFEGSLLGVAEDRKVGSAEDTFVGGVDTKMLGKSESSFEGS